MPSPEALPEGLRGTVDRLRSCCDSDQCAGATQRASSAEQLSGRTPDGAAERTPQPHGVMDQEKHGRADQLFEEALGKTGAKDPREFYRKRLREMKADNPDAYREAVAYYEDELVPSIAEAGDDPLMAWQRFGCRMAELTVTGTPIEIDPTGRRHPYTPPTASDRMVLHIPQGSKGRALVVGLPPELSAAQLATYDLLVSGRQRLQDEGTDSPDNHDD